MRRITLITGATGGIGRALAQQLAPHDTLILTGRDPTKLDTLCASLPDAWPLVFDMERPERITTELLKLDRLDALVNNAGVVTHGPLADVEHDLWQRVFAVNVFAPAALTRACVPLLRASEGQAVFVNSVGGLRVNAGWGVYGAAKFALRALADGLRAEEAERGVRVTTVYPGRTATPMMQKVRDYEAAPYEPERYADAGSVAQAIKFALDTPRDASVAELTVIPATQGRI